MLQAKSSRASFYPILIISITITLLAAYFLAIDLQKNYLESYNSKKEVLKYCEEMNFTSYFQSDSPEIEFFCVKGVQFLDGTYMVCSKPVKEE